MSDRLPKRGYLDFELEKILAESYRRDKAQIVYEDIKRLMVDFGYFNESYTHRPYSLPEAKWDRRGNRVGFWLNDHNGKDLPREELADIDPKLYPLRVFRIDMVYLPKDGDYMTVATIKPHAGADASTIVSDYEGKEFSVDELRLLKEDIETYRELVKVGLSVNPQQSNT